MEALTTAAKACQQGPLFHFRVSKYGVSLITGMSTSIMQQRSTAVYSRRAGELTAVIEAVRGKVIANADEFDQHREEFAKVTSHLKFMQQAPKNFGNVHEKAEVQDYKKFVEGIQTKMLASWLGACSSGAKATASTLPVGEGAKPAAPQSAKALEKMGTFFATIALVEEHLSAACAKPIASRVPGLRHLTRLVELADTKFSKGDLDKAVCVEYSKTLSAFKDAAKTLADAKEDLSDKESVLRVCGVQESEIDDDLNQNAEEVENLLRKLKSQTEKFGKKLVDQATAHFTNTLFYNTKPFRDEADSNAMDPARAFLPFEFTSENCKEILSGKFPEFFDGAAQFQRDEDAYLDVRSIAEVWAEPFCVRALQVLRDVSDAQVAFAQLGPLLAKDVIGACPAPIAHQSARSKAAGQHEMVPTAVLSKLLKLKASVECLKFPEHEGADAESLACKHELHKFYENATAAVSVLVDLLSTRWIVALKSATEAMKSYLPAGDWKEYGITDFDEGQAAKEIVGNPNHLKLAQLAEWMSTNAAAIAAANKQLDNVVSKRQPELLTGVGSLVEDAKTAVGLVLVFRLVLADCRLASTTVDTLEKRATAATEVKVRERGRFRVYTVASARSPAKVATHGPRIDANESLDSGCACLGDSPANVSLQTLGQRAPLALASRKISAGPTLPQAPRTSAPCA